MTTTFEQKLRHQHPIGPEWQNPERIDVGDTVSLASFPEGIGTVCNVHAYKDELNIRPGTHTFALVSFEGITSGAEWVDVKNLSKQWEAVDALEDEDKFKGQMLKACGEEIRAARRDNQLAVRQAIDHAQGTVKLVLMALPYEQLHNQFVKKVAGVTEVCNLIEHALLEFFDSNNRST